MSRPYKRACEECGKKFICKSNGRVYCYQCSPPQHVGAGRKDGRPGGMGLDPDSNVPEKDDVASTLSPVSKSDALVDRMASDVKDQTTAVLEKDRPKKGWGKCRHVDPKKPNKEICDDERWSDRVPFCRKHVEVWRKLKEDRAFKKMVDEEVDSLSKLKPKDFKFKNAQEAADFLGKVNYAIFKGTIPISKAKALKDMALAQVKALDSGALAMKIEAMMKAKQGEGGEFEGLTAKDLERDIDLANRLKLLVDEEDGKKKSKTG